MDLVKVLEYGVGAIAVVGLIYVSLSLTGIIKNHVAHATKASQRLASMIEQLITYLERKNGGK